MIKPGPVQLFILVWASNCRIRGLSVRCDNLWCDEKCNFLINKNILAPEELQFCKWFKFSLTDFSMIVRPFISVREEQIQDSVRVKSQRISHTVWLLWGNMFRICIGTLSAVICTMHLSVLVHSSSQENVL